MKTLADLNKWWWYRLLKVIYVLVISICSLGIIAGFVFGSIPQVDSYNSYIECTNGKKFHSWDSDLYFYSEEMSDTNKATAQRLCTDVTIERHTEGTMTEETVQRLREKYGITSVSDPLSNGGRIMSGSAFLDGQEPQPVKQNYKPVTVYDSEIDWYWAIPAGLVSLLLLFAIAEVLKRIFYYVVLGSLKPKKN